MRFALHVALRLVRYGVIEVRSDGSVWKMKNLNAIVLHKPRRLETQGKNGYLLVKVCENGKQFLVSAHTLVWTVLNGPIPEGLDVNHEDGNKANNHPSNLTLVTRGENHKHAYRTGLRSRSNFAGDYSERAASLRKAGLSYSQIASELGISQTTAFRAVQYQSEFRETA